MLYIDGDGWGLYQIFFRVIQKEFLDFIESVANTNDLKWICNTNICWNRSKNQRPSYFMSIEKSILLQTLIVKYRKPHQDTLQNNRVKRLSRSAARSPNDEKITAVDAPDIEMHALILNYSKCINISPCMFGALRALRASALTNVCAGRHRSRLS